MRIVRTYDDEIRTLEQHIRAQSRPDAPMQILEAGCGREWFFRMDGLQYELTGLDIDAAALQARVSDKGDLAHHFVGDLRTAELPAGRYDVIYCAFVLEHVDGAELVLKNFARWLKPGGILIVRVPDRDSVQGFISRFTPHWLHVLYYRWAWKKPNAGKPGFAPYPTVYDAVVSRRGLRAFCARNGMSVIDEMGVGTFRRGHGVAARITPIVAALISMLTLGQVHAKYVDLTVVARR